MQLKEILQGIKPVAISGRTELDIPAIRYDSRQVQPGDLFVAICGEKLDAYDFVPSALERGAAAVMSERPAPAEFKPTWIQVRSARQALALAAANFYHHPARTLKLIGVTGTNGKTTTAYLLESVLRAADQRTGLIGTVEYHLPSGIIPAPFTTPESLDLQIMLAQMRDAGLTWAVMEVSSHGLALDRIYGIPFAAAVFTNLARDHLDFHGDFEHYFQAKKRLFIGHGAPPPPIVALNVDDPHGQQLRHQCSGNVWLYGMNHTDPQVVTAKRPTLSFDGIRFTLESPVGSAEVHSPLVGRPNLANILAAAAASLALGLPLEKIVAGIEALTSVPGRFERIDEGQPFAVVVDFAHTDLALQTLLQTARELCRGRVLIVFGCGGDRDRSKRPIMGEIAARLADLVILTSDNPRSEDPARIVNDILVGVQKAEGNYLIELNRRRAFQRAFETAAAGDIVLLAGKGHQAEIIFRDYVEPWSEQETARTLLRQLGFGKNTTRAKAPVAEARQ